MVPLLLLPAFLAAQLRCDTLITTRDAVISARILRKDHRGILYCECSFIETRSSFIPSKDLKEIKLRSSRSVYDPARLSSVPPNRSPEKSKLRKAGPSGRPKVIIWAGLEGVGSLTGREDYGQNGGRYHLGIEAGLENNPGLRVAVLILPFSTISSKSSFRKESADGEIALKLKKFTVGRLSGAVSKFYWGADVRFGQSTYSYLANNRRVFDISTWERFMICAGFQFTHEGLAFNLALPVGIQHFWHHKQGGGIPLGGKGLCYQPGFSVGLSL